MEFTDDEKQSLVKILLMAARSDGQFHHKEKQFMLGVLDQLGMKAEEIEDPDQIEFSLPDSEQLRMTMLYYLLFLVKSDEKISEEEAMLVRKFGVMLGFRHRMIGSMVAIMENHIDRKLPREALIQAILPYLN